MKAQTKKANGTSSPIRIFTDGAGCRPDGKGSGYAWLRQDTGLKNVIHEDGLTNNQAEYRGIFAAIESLDAHAKAEILTDSENTCFQLRGDRRVRDPYLARLHAQIQEAISNKHLAVTFTWIPRRENLAGKLI